METFCAINTFYQLNECANTDGIPHMYICDDVDNFVDLLKNDEQYISWLKQINIFDLTKYTTAYISAFTYNHDDIGAESYIPYAHLRIQDLYPLDKTGVLDNLIKVCFDYLYTLSFDVSANFGDDYIEDCLNIYKKLKQKFGSKISKLTIVNSIRSHLETGDILSDLSYANIEITINKIQEILNNEE